MQVQVRFAFTQEYRFVVCNILWNQWAIVRTRHCALNRIPRLRASQPPPLLKWDLYVLSSFSKGGGFPEGEDGGFETPGMMVTYILLT